MMAVIVGGDEVSRVGCKSVIRDIYSDNGAHISNDFEDFERVIAECNFNWIIVLGWSIDIKAVADRVNALQESAPEMILISPPAEPNLHSIICRTGFELGFAGVLSAASDPAVLRAFLTRDTQDDVAQAFDSGTRRYWNPEERAERALAVVH